MSNLANRLLRALHDARIDAVSHPDCSMDSAIARGKDRHYPNLYVLTAFGLAHKRLWVADMKRKHGDTPPEGFTDDSN